MTLKWNHKSEDKVLALGTDAFIKGLVVLGAAIPGRGAVSLLYGYSTEAGTDAVPTHYPGAELRWLLPRGGDLRVFYGRLTGGRVCVSGSCRDVPPFQGARLDLVVRF